MKRRTLLTALATGATASLAGCSTIFGDDETNNTSTDPERVGVAENTTNPQDVVEEPDGGYLDENAELKTEEVEGKEDIHKVLAAKQSYEIAYSLIFASNEDINEVIDALEADKPKFDEARTQLDFAKKNTERAIKLANTSRKLLQELNETKAVEIVEQGIRNKSNYKDMYEEWTTLIEEYEQGNRKYVAENGEALFGRFNELRRNNIAWGRVGSEIDIEAYYKEAAENQSN